ncbi:TIGR04086 family membrane protein, partial [Turicibacter sanguinis]|nr:TIGR04086 family membrane protein [Turicibacter sanguinis]
MTQKLGRALLYGLSFIVISILILGLLITTFAYFEWLSVGALEKLIYASY